MERKELTDLDLKAISQAIRKCRNKDDNAYKITVYYEALSDGTLDEGGIVIATAKIVNIEKYLRKWVKEHPNAESTIRQPEESALVLIDDLRNRGLFE